MVQSRKKRKDKKKLLGSHQRSWIWGRHAVTEILEGGRWPMSELYLSDALDPDEGRVARSRAEALGYAVHIDSSERLRELCKSGEHQGCLAKMLAYPYAKLEEIEKRLQADSFTTVAILDRIQDPYNFGAIIRSAEVLGIAGIIIGEADQVGVTSMVARASAGAVNHIPIVQAGNLIETVSHLKSMGVQFVAASEKEAASLTDFSCDGPRGIILGNEGGGIRTELLELSDTRIAIPQKGRVESLNVAAAAAILFHHLN